MKYGEIYLPNMVAESPYGRASIADRPPHRIAFVRHFEDGSSDLWEGTLTVDEMWDALKDHLAYTHRTPHQ